MSARFHNPDGVHKPMGYSHVAEQTGGRLVYIAGQVSVDPSGNIVGEGDLEAQARQVFANIKANLAAVGATFADVIKLNYYIVQSDGIPSIRKVRDEFVNTGSPPASTLVIVSGLARPEFLVEVEAIASIPS
jgi:enamine deaminase RidA (YjgF/YER057c/UK114 family)